MVAVTLFFTVAAALGLGIIVGYLMISTILHAMRRRPQPATEPALLARDAHSGD